MHGPGAIFLTPFYSVMPGLAQNLRGSRCFWRTALAIPARMSRCRPIRLPSSNAPCQPAESWTLRAALKIGALRSLASEENPPPKARPVAPDADSAPLEVQGTAFGAPAGAAVFTLALIRIFSRSRSEFRHGGRIQNIAGWRGSSGRSGLLTAPITGKERRSGGRPNHRKKRRNLLSDKYLTSISGFPNPLIQRGLASATICVFCGTRKTSRFNLKGLFINAHLPFLRKCGIGGEFGVRAVRNLPPLLTGPDSPRAST